MSLSDKSFETNAIGKPPISRASSNSRPLSTQRKRLEPDAGGVSTQQASLGISGTTRNKEFSTGDKVRIKRPPGKPGFDDGKIVRKNDDGSYLVKFDKDGTQEDVKVTRIVASPTTDSASSSHMAGSSLSEDNVFFVGEKVDALFKGGKQYFSGKVIADNKDSTYGILFDDGDKDDRVPSTNIRRKEGYIKSFSAFGYIITSFH